MRRPGEGLRGQHRRRPERAPGLAPARRVLAIILRGGLRGDLLRPGSQPGPLVEDLARLRLGVVREQELARVTGSSFDVQIRRARRGQELDGVRVAVEPLGVLVLLFGFLGRLD